MPNMNTTNSNDVRGTYKKTNKGTGTMGFKFQIDMSIITALNANETLEYWKLSTENAEAGKFDDIVLQCPDTPDGDVLIQSKYKQNRHVTLNDLLSTNSKNDDFSLAKYFFSYQKVVKTRFSRFRVKNVVICTNTTIKIAPHHQFFDNHRVESDSMLFCQGHDISYYTLNERIVPDLKESLNAYYRHNLKNEVDLEATITEENIKDFLKHLQLYYEYPSGRDLKIVIKQMCENQRHSWGKITYENLHDKFSDWYEREKGEYLTETTIKGVFSEIRSTRYFDKRDFAFRNDFTFQNTRIFHVTAGNGYLLPLLKIYQTLENQNKTALYINLPDDIKVMNHTIEAYQCPRYEFLVVTCNRFLVEERRKEMLDMLWSTLNEYEYKKLVLIVEYNNKLIRRIEWNSGLDVIDGNVTFEDLSQEMQDTLLSQTNIFFEGYLFSLRELLDTNICAKILKKLKNEEIYDDKPLLINGYRTMEMITQFDINCNNMIFKLPRDVEDVKMVRMLILENVLKCVTGECREFQVIEPRTGPLKGS